LHAQLDEHRAEKIDFTPPKCGDDYRSGSMKPELGRGAESHRSLFHSGEGAPFGREMD